MNLRTNFTENTMTRFFLEKLSDEEKQGIEAQMLHDPDLVDLLGAVEDELVDGYINGELSAEDQRAFAMLSASSPRLGEKVAFARALAEVVAETPAASHSQPQSHFAPIVKFPSSPLRTLRPSQLLPVAAALLIMVFGGTLALRQGLFIPERTPQATEVALSVDLFPGTVRDLSSIPLLEIPPGEDWVRIRLDLPGRAPYESYEVVLENAGRKIRNWTDLEATPPGSGEILELVMATEVLRKGNFLLTVQGLSAAGESQVVAYYELAVSSTDSKID